MEEITLNSFQQERNSFETESMINLFSNVTGFMDELITENRIFHFFDYLKQITGQFLNQIIDERVEFILNKKINELENHYRKEQSSWHEKLFLSSAYGFSFLSLIVGICLQEKIFLFVGVGLFLIILIHTFDS